MSGWRWGLDAVETVRHTIVVDEPAPRSGPFGFARALPPADPAQARSCPACAAGRPHRHVPEPLRYRPWPYDVSVAEALGLR